LRPRIRGLKCPFALWTGEREPGNRRRRFQWRVSNL
jgi:hypothetical protein